MTLTQTELTADIERLLTKHDVAEANYYDSVKRRDNRRIAYWSNQVEWLTRALHSRQRDLADYNDEPTQLELI